MDPVIVTRQPGKFVDQRLVDHHDIAPVAELLADQCLQGRPIVEVDLPRDRLLRRRRCRFAVLRRQRLKARRILVHPGEAQQAGALGVDFGEHRLQGHADLDFVFLETYQVGVDAHPFGQLDHRQFLRHFINEVGQGRNARHGVAV
ncbi:hypothetical protein D3C87_1719510 [compost metagenome]